MKTNAPLVLCTLLLFAAILGYYVKLDRRLEELQAKIPDIKSVNEKLENLEKIIKMDEVFIKAAHVEAASAGLKLNSMRAANDAYFKQLLEAGDISLCHPCFEESLRRLKLRQPLRLLA